MPQFLNTSTSPEIDKAIEALVSEALPHLTPGGWAEALQANGLSTNSLAQMYVESLTNCKPAQRVKAITELLETLGVSQARKEEKSAPTLIVNGETVNIMAMALPQRDW